MLYISKTGIFSECRSRIQQTYNKLCTEIKTHFYKPCCTDMNLYSAFSMCMCLNAHTSVWKVPMAAELSVYQSISLPTQQTQPKCMWAGHWWQTVSFGCTHLTFNTWRLKHKATRQTELGDARLCPLKNPRTLWEQSKSKCDFVSKFRPSHSILTRNLLAFFFSDSSVPSKDTTPRCRNATLIV